MLRKTTSPIPVHVECSACYVPVKEAILRTGLIIRDKDKDIHIDDPIIFAFPKVKVDIDLPDDNEATLKAAEKKIREALDDVGLLRDENEEHTTELAPATTAIPFYQRKLPMWLRLVLGGFSVLSGVAIMALMLSGIGIPFAVMAGLGAFSAVFSLILGAPTIIRATKQLWYHRTSMDTLLALSGLTSIGVSIAHLFVPGLPMLFDAPLFIFGFQYLGDAAKEKFSIQLAEDSSFKDRLKPTIKVEGVPRHVVLEKIAIGNIICVPRGVVIPIDGEILDDEAMVYETILNGDTMPRLHGKNSKVKSGMRIAGNNLKDYVRIQTTATYANSHLSRLEKDLSDAKKITPTLADWSQKIVTYFVPIILMISLGLFIASFFAPPLLLAAILTLASACPCSIGLVAPAMTKAAMMKAGQEHVFFKNEDAIKAATQIDMVLFDWNGTLTTGEPIVTAFVGEKDETLFSYIAALQENSDHAFARAIREYTAKSPLTKYSVENPTPSHNGISGVVNGKRIVIGNETMMTSHAIKWNIPSFAGSMTTAVAVDGKIVGYFKLEDPLRKGALAAINAIRAKGIQVGILSGAAKSTFNHCKGLLGIDLIYADCADKFKQIQELQVQGKRVAFIGDGVNDAIGMLASNLGVAIKSSSSDELTRSFADAIIDSSSLLPVVALFETAKQAVTAIEQTITFNLAANSLAVTIAVGVGIAVACGALLALSFVLNPGFGAAAMFLLFGVIVARALHLRAKELPEYEEAKKAVEMQDVTSQRFSSRGIVEGLDVLPEPLSDQSRARQQAVQKQRLSQEVVISKAVTSDAFVPLADARGSALSRSEVTANNDTNQSSLSISMQSQ